MLSESHGTNILVSLIYDIKFNGLLLVHFAKISTPIASACPQQLSVTE